MKIKILLGATCVVGLAAAAFGMARENDVAFILGIALVAAAYLAIRKIYKPPPREKP